MSGKGPIIGVLGLGLVASLCAAVLMAAVRGGGEVAETAPTEETVVVARGDIAPMTRIEKDLIEVKTVRVGEAPEGGFSDPVQILGRVVKVGLVEGQPIIEDRLLSDEAGEKLASSLPEGMRAVSVELPSSSAMRGLLYPGCRVDVIASFRHVGGRADSAGPVSRTLLQNVTVLAVEHKTVFTVEPEPAEGEEPKAAPPARNPGRTLMVTLMVDPQQARELQSSRDLGELSLSLRNPLDDSVTEDPVRKIDGPAAAQAEPPGPVRLPAEAEHWTTLVIRGDKTEIRTFNAEGRLEDGVVKPVVPAKGVEYADVPTYPEIDE